MKGMHATCLFAASVAKGAMAPGWFFRLWGERDDFNRVEISVSKSGNVRWTAMTKHQFLGFQMFVDSGVYHFFALGKKKRLFATILPRNWTSQLDASRFAMRVNRRSMETIDIPSWIYWIMDVSISINIYWPYTCNCLTLLSVFLLKSNRPIARVNNIA